MGLFDDVAGSVMGKVMNSSQGGMAQVAMEIFKQYGGLNGILDKFKESGLGDAAASWVGNGENFPISAEQISSVFGSGHIADMAEKFGISPEVLSSQIAENLPNLINKMTPNGEITNDNSGLLSTILSMLK